MLKERNPLFTGESEKINKKKYLLIYSAIFAVIAFIVFYHFIEYGITFVRQGDGYNQHYTALEYLGKWLRSIIYTLFNEHKLVIPNWDFSIGLGSDVITTFNYYVIGDPLAVLSAFVPVKYTPHLYTFLCLLRFYLIGLCFSLYCFERKHKNFIGVLVSAFTYTFCSYALYAGTMHPYFINPMIYLPLILISVEKIFQNRNPIYLALIVCVAEISNFYFFYVVVIATVVYVLFRLIEMYKTDIKAMITPLFKIGFSSVSGVLLGAVIFFPIVMKLFADSRMSVDYDYSLFYHLKYYLRLPAAMVSHNYWGGWTLLGYSVIILFAVTALFSVRKKHTCLKAFFLVAFVGFMTPKFAGFANGFSYPCNRWGFVFSLIISFAVSALWNDIFQAKSKKRLIAIAVVPVAYVALCFLSDYTIPERMIFTTISAVLICAGILVYRFVLNSDKRFGFYLQLGVLALCLGCIGINAHFAFVENEDKYYSVSEINNFYADDSEKVKKQTKLDEQTEFFRFTGDSLSYNDSVRKKMNNTQFYWSLSDENISAFHESVNINEAYYQQYTGFDGIASLNTLSSVLYYYDNPKNKNHAIPYGYEKTETENVYRNTNALPLGYTYDGYILRSEYDSLATSLDKQQALLQSVVLEQDSEKAPKLQPQYITNKLESKMILKDKNVTFKDNTFTVTKDDSIVYFELEPQQNSELYISLKGIDFEGTSLYSLYTDDLSVDPNNLYTTEDFNALSQEHQEKLRLNHTYWTETTIVPFDVGTLNAEKDITSVKKINYFTPDFTFYCNKTGFDANLGYSEEGHSYVALRFPYIGSYSFEDISFYSQTMDLYEQSVSKLAEETLENVTIGTDIVTGDITVSKDKLLCLSIPYSDGWRAFVDGKETEVKQANIMYMALEIPKGEHKIELRYSMPDQKLGLVISICGFMLIFGYEVWYYMSVKKRETEIKEND